MKNIFTKAIGAIVMLGLFVAIALPARAQYVKTVDDNTGYFTAITKDGVGNIYVIKAISSTTGSVIKYFPNSASPTTGHTIFTGLDMTDQSDPNGGDAAWGLAVNSTGDVYLTTNFKAGSTTTGLNVVNGVALGQHGNVIKLSAGGAGFSATSYTASVFLNGGLYYSGLAFDSSDHLYVLQEDDTNLDHSTVTEYSPPSTTAAQLFNNLNNDISDNFPHNLAVASNGDIYVTNSGEIEQEISGGGSGHKGDVRRYAYSSSTPHYSNSNFTPISQNTYPMALALDPNGNLFVEETDGSQYVNYRLNEYSSSNTLIHSDITSLDVGFVAPDGVVAVSSSNFYALDGNDPGALWEFTGPVGTQATGVSFSAIGATTATISWTNGTGDNRAVFMLLGSAGQPAPANSTNYTANTAFAAGGAPTEIGSTGWYCVYNGTGTSVNVTGLNPNSSYRVQVDEYNGTTNLTNENYLTSAGTSNNPNNFTTATPTIVALGGTVTVPSTTETVAGTSTSFNITGTNLIGNITATAPTNFQVSSNNSSWGSTATITASGTLSSTPVYVRLSGSGTVGAQSGSVALGSSSATTVNQSVSGTVLQPTITAPGGTTTLTATASGTPGTSVSFNISGSNLLGNITVTAPSNVQVSSDNSTWGSTATINESGGTLSSTSVYVRLAGTGTVGTISGSVALSSSSATTVNQAVSGSLNAPAVATTTSLTSSNNPSFSASPGNSVTFTATVTHSGTLVTESTVSFTSNGVAISGGSNVALNSSGQAAVTTSFSSSGSNAILATFNADANFLTSTSSTLTQQVNVHAPAIASTGTPGALSTTVGTASPSTSFNVSGAFMTAGILVSPPTGFEVSTDNNNFTSTVTVGAAGTIASTPVYIRLAASDAVGTYSGNIVLSSSGATNINVATLNSGVFTPPGNALSFDGVDDGITMGTPPATVSGNFTVEAWVLPADGTKDMHVFSTRSTGNNSFDIQIASGSTIHGDIGTGSAWLTTAANAAFSYHAGQWIHLAYVVTTTGYSIYANGNLVGSGTYSGTPLLLDNTHYSTIGFDPGESTYFNGSIDEVRVYKSALSQANIQADMLSTASSVPLNLVNYYNFDSGAAGGTNTGVNTLTDKTTTGYNGTLSNFALSGATSNWVESYAMVVPAATAASGFSSSGFTANWTAPTIGTVTNYFVDVSTSSAFTSVISGSPFSTTSTSQAISSLTAGTTYYYRVRADKTSVTGEGDYSAVITATVPVSISSLSIAGGSPTNAASVNYTATFGSAITGLTASNFSITASGPTGTSVSTPTTSDGGVTWTVPVSTGTGDGTIQLVLQNATGISPGISTSLPFAGQTYTVDKTAPTVVSLSRADPNPTNETQLDYQITFSEPVIGVDLTDFSAVTSGVSAGPISVSPLSSTVYNITVANVSGDGTVEVNLNSSGTGITDVAGNAIAAGFSGDTYNVQQTPPSVSSITATTPGNINPTNATSVSYTVTFSEAVIGVSNASFAATITNTVAYTGITVTPVSSSVYTVTINGISGDGTLRLDLKSGGTGITDLAGNAISGGFTGGDVYNIDNTPPTVQSITATTPSNINPTNATSVTYTVTFSEPVTGVSNLGFMATATNTVVSSGITVTPVSSSVYTVTVSGISGDGTLRLDLNNSNTGIFDLAFNPISGGFTGDVYNIDNTAPVLNGLIYASNNTNSNYAKAGDVVTLLFGANEALQTPAVTIAGHSITAVSTGVNSYSASYTMTSGDTEGRIPFSLTVTDIAGNSGNYNDVAAGDDITFDMTPPMVAISAPSVAGIGNNGTGTVTYTVTYADANFGTSNLTNGGITLNANGTAGTAVVSGSGTSYTVTISGITGLGTLGISVGAGYATDLAGNADLGAGPSATFNVLSSDATLSNLTLDKGNLSPGFLSGTISYTAAVGNAVSSINITPTVNQANATVTINGSPATPGTAFGPIALAEGAQTLINIVVTAQDGATTKTYTLTVTRAPSPEAYLAIMSVNTPIRRLALSPAFAYNNYSYTTDVVNSVSSVTVTPSLIDTNGTIKVNGATVKNKTTSDPITLAEGTQTVINIVVTAQNGTTTKTYTLTVTRAPSAQANLAIVAVNTPIRRVALSPAFTFNNYSYTANVANSDSSVTIKPSLIDTNGTITVNGKAVGNKKISDPITLAVGPNTITVVVTAQNGIATKTYTVTVTRAGSSEAYLAIMTIKTAALSPAFAYNTYSYTSNVDNSVSSVTVTPSLIDTTGTIKVNGKAVGNKTTTDPIMLAVGQDTINVVVTAQDSVSTHTYAVIITRAPSGTDSYNPGISVTKPTETPQLADDGIIIHQGVSPNGDGINDFLQIDNISQYPDNKLSIMNRNGQLIYETHGYDNSSKIFDGHSNKDGQMQLPGTYFYQLDYTVSGITKHKTGFIVLKY